MEAPHTIGQFFVLYTVSSISLCLPAAAESPTQLLESLTVSAKCHTEVESSFNLEFGKEYFILATGTYVYNNHGNYADAEWEGWSEGEWWEAPQEAGGVGRIHPTST